MLLGIFFVKVFDDSAFFLMFSFEFFLFGLNDYVCMYVVEIQKAHPGGRSGFGTLEIFQPLPVTATMGLCLRAVGAHKLVEILIKGAIPLVCLQGKYELHPDALVFLPFFSLFFLFFFVFFFLFFSFCIFFDLRHC